MKKDMFMLEKQMVFKILKEKLKDQAAAEQIYELFERESESERDKRCLKQKEGISKARESGVALGRPKLEVPDNFDEILLSWNKGELTAQTAARMCGIGVSTFYRRTRAVFGENGSKSKRKGDEINEKSERK